MNTLRMTAVAGLLMSTGALGEVKLIVTPLWAESDLETRSARLTFAFDNPDGRELWGFSLRGTPWEHETLRIVGRSPLGTATDPTDADVVGRIMEATNDLGYTGDVGVGMDARQVPAMTLDIRLNRTVQAPVGITFRGLAVDTAFNEYEFEEVDVRLIPEPGGMLLLSVMGAVVARRRRRLHQS